MKISSVNVTKSANKLRIWSHLLKNLCWKTSFLRSVSLNFECSSSIASGGKEEQTQALIKGFYGIATYALKKLHKILIKGTAMEILFRKVTN